MRGALVALGFVIGMDGVIATIGPLAVSVTYLLVRGAVALSLLAAVLLAVDGLRLVTRRASLCARTLALPPRPVACRQCGRGVRPCRLSRLRSDLYRGRRSRGRIGECADLGARDRRLRPRQVAGAAQRRCRRRPLAGAARCAQWRLDLGVGTLFLVGALYYLLGTVETVVPDTGGVLAG